MSRVIGVTGGFGTGKSTVSRIFRGLGGSLLDADKITHEAILRRGSAYKKVVSLFGVSILKKNREIDRKKLARIVFNDREKLALLNSVIHPEVIKKIKERIEKGRGPEKIYIVDAPLLIEAGCLDMIDKLVVVSLNRKTQIKRCMTRWHLSEEDVKKRIRSQAPLTKKRRMADFIIDNNGSLNSTKRLVEKVWREIKDGTGKD